MAGLACEALNRMFQKEQTELVAQVNLILSFLFYLLSMLVNFKGFINCIVYMKQALRVELVPYLLKLLEGIGLETLDNPSATKAQIVKALKSMTRSLQYGEQVSQYICYFRKKPLSIKVNL